MSDLHGHTSHDDKVAFEQWYINNAFDYELQPIGSRECALQRKSWIGAKAAEQVKIESLAAQVNKFQQLHSESVRAHADMVWENSVPYAEIVADREKLSRMQTRISTSYIVSLDGDQWCAVAPGFINLQESDAAFADTPVEALQLLLPKGG